jgi:aryl-alcohol dehydrogenase-like predicted oxidoreductase
MPKYSSPLRGETMEKRKIGSLEVSVAGLGCNNFGWRIDAAATARVVDAALDAGINFLDSADVYGSGASEEFLGQALKGRWDRVVIATKFGSKLEGQGEGASPDYIRRAAEASLRRLQTDRIDLYQLHRPDPKTPIADTLETLDQLVKAGKVREIGASNFSAGQVREAEEAVRSGAARFVSVQNEYSLMHREPEKDVLPECIRRGLAFLPYFPLANGLLTGKYRPGQELPPGSRGEAGWGPKVFTEENLETAEKLRRFAESRGHSLLELAFSWLASQPAVASVIAGARTPEQARSNAHAVNWKLTDADVTEINRILAQHSATPAMVSGNRSA